MQTRINRQTQRAALMALLACLLATAAGAVNVRDFGATGDGLTDDTAAIQAAINSLPPPAGGSVYFPAGTYVVRSVNIWHGLELYGETDANGAPLAVIRRPPNQGKWTRTFTTQNTPWQGTNDSPLLHIHHLRFDGNRAEQGEYRGYELEQAHLIFLTASPAQPGRLKARVEHCSFHDGVADAVGVYLNCDVEVADCDAWDVFRGGVVLIGGHSKLLVRNFTAGGDEHDTGIDIEPDGAGYGGSYVVEVTLTNLHLQGDFDIGFGGDGTGSSLTADAVTVEQGYSGVIAYGGTVRIANSSFGFNGDQNLIQFPGQTTFSNCQFIATKQAGDTATNLKAFSVIWETQYFAAQGQRLTFQDCRWQIGEGIVPATDVCDALFTYAGDASRDNRLLVQGGAIAPGYQHGIYLSQGGTAVLSNTAIAAATAVTLGSSTGYYLDATLDGVRFTNGVVTSEHIVTYSPNNRITHRNLTVDEAFNTLATTYGLVGNTYLGGRLVLGTPNPTAANTPGLVGDRYRLKSSAPGQLDEWVCTASHPTAASWTPVIKINFQPATAPVPAGYLRDSGLTYRAQNGYSYGWNTSHTGRVYDRNKNSDQRLDTLCRLYSGARWEIALPNGAYDVRVSVGDAASSSQNTLRVEGVSYWTNLNLARNVFASDSRRVTVSDGRLTLDQGSAPNTTTRVNYIEISPAP